MSGDRFQNPDVAEQALPEFARESPSLWTRFRTAEDGPLLLLREVAISVGIVLVIGLLLFGTSGVWPPMVAVESESMEPNIGQYDLIFVTEPGRFAPDAADRNGVVTADSVDGGGGDGHRSFDNPGSVVVYDNPASQGSPIIHRAHFYVEEGENWYDRANPEYVEADSCAELESCPAEHSGYITKGDNQNSNGQYDQANGIAPVVRPEWITGIAQLRLPYVGYIRLALTGAASFGPLVPAGLGAIGAGGAVAIGRRELLR
ncbi:MAG: S26 family signal peptidase [Halohasta sp.]